MAFLGLLSCLLEQCLKELTPAIATQQSEGSPQDMEIAPPELLLHVDEVFLFALTWSIGASCDAPSQRRFAEEVRELAQKADLNTAAFEDRVAIHDFAYEPLSRKWIPWMDTVPAFQIEDPLGEPAVYEEIAVPTVDSVRMTSMMGRLLEGGRHVMCPGVSGTGKSMTIARLLRREVPQSSP